MKNIIIPLQLQHTVPSTDDSINFALTGYQKDSFLTSVAKPYNWQGHHIAPVQYKYQFSPAAGLMSTVADLAKYSNAIDDKQFLQPATWEKVFTPYTSPKGKKIQYGLGWFVTYFRGIKMVWHTG